MPTGVDDQAVGGLTQDEWVLANPNRVHAAGFGLIDTYPSQCVPPHLAPEPMLLDTCTIQHLEWARRSVPQGSESSPTVLDPIQVRLGAALTKELCALVDLELMAQSDLPFCVSLSSRQEFASAPTSRRDTLVAEWNSWNAYAQRLGAGQWPTEALTGAAAPVPVHPAQLSIPGIELPTARGPFSDAGDRALIQDAVRCRVPAILTTDLRTFWQHRQWLYEKGIEVWRPSDLRQAYINYTTMPGNGVTPPRRGV